MALKEAWMVPAYVFWHYQMNFAETCSCREVVEVLVTTPAELDGGSVADE